MSSSFGGENKSLLWTTIPMIGWISEAIQTLSFHQARHGAQSVSLQFLSYIIFWIFSIYVKNVKKNMFLIGFKMTYNIIMIMIQILDQSDLRVTHDISTAKAKRIQ